MNEMSVKTSNQLQPYMGKIITQPSFFYDACFFKYRSKKSVYCNTFGDLKAHCSRSMSFQSFMCNLLWYFWGLYGGAFHIALAMCNVLFLISICYSINRHSTELLTGLKPRLGFIYIGAECESDIVSRSVLRESNKNAKSKIPFRVRFLSV